MTPVPAMNRRQAAEAGWRSAKTPSTIAQIITKIGSWTNRSGVVDSFGVCRSGVSRLPGALNGPARFLTR